MAGFVGLSNVLDGAQAQRLTGQPGACSLRPEKIELLPVDQGVLADRLSVEGQIADIQYHGAMTRYDVALADGGRLVVTSQNRRPAGGTRWAVDQPVRLSWHREDMQPLTPSTTGGPVSLAHAQAVAAAPGPLAPLANALHRHPQVLLLLLLGPPLLWLGVVYLGSLFALLTQSFFSIDEFTGLVRREFTLSTYAELGQPANLDIILRTATMAACVSLAAACIAFPIAYYMARYARGRMKALFYLAVMLPLWSSYLVRVYSWKLILAKEGILNWVLEQLAPDLAARGRAGDPGDRRAVAVDQLHRHLPGVPLHLAALHDPADPGGVGARAAVAARRLGRPGRAAAPDLSPGDPAARPAGGRRRLDLHLLADPGRLHHPADRRLVAALPRSGRLHPPGHGREHSARRRFHRGADRDHGGLPDRRETPGGLRCALAVPAPGASLGLKIAAVAGLLFLHVPLLLIFLYAFTTEDKSYQFPPPGLTLKWFAVAWERQDVWNALTLSLRVATVSTAIALVLGTLAAAALSRTRFFGRESVSLLIILPIALPGIITGISLRSAFNLAEIPFSFWTIVLGHATFCVVIVYNNVVARFRRTSASLIEASMDLGADGFQTFRYVVLPSIATALLAGGMLAFALSFDEVIVTTFTAGQQSTLPIWMLTELVRPRQRPVTNVVAVFVILVTFLPILAAYYLTRGSEPGERN